MNIDQSNRLVESVVLLEFGKFDKIKVMKWPLIPEHCGNHDVEVKVTYCAINFADLYMRQGLMQDVKLPCVLGLECVGYVADAGHDVNSFQRGQRVLCYKGDGGLYRETVIVNEKNCFYLPDYIDDKTAVTLPANYLTAYFCLFDIGNLRSGQNVLIHSCAGGVGWAATQLAKTRENVTVVGTASVSKHSEVQSNNVDYVLKPEDYVEELNKLSIKLDIIIDNVGGSNIAISQSLLNPLGKVIIIGVNHIVKGEDKIGLFKLFKLWWQTKNISVADLIMNNNSVAGLHLTNLMGKNPERVKEIMNFILHLYKSQKIKPKIDSIYPLQQAVEAMKKLSNRQNVGKVIITIE